MTTRAIQPQAGPVTRAMDRVKRPVFLGFFLMALLGLVSGHFILFGSGTLGFCFVGVVHLFMRRSSVPLLGNYLGMGRYLRISRSGKILLGLTLVIGLTAINARINLLLMVLGMLLGVIIISGVLSENSLRRLRAKISLPATAFVGTPFPVRLTLENGKKHFPSYSLDIGIQFRGHGRALSSSTYVLKVPPGRSVTLEHMLNIGTRGRKTVHRLRIATRFPFGLFEKWSHADVAGEVLMFPQLGRIPGRLVPTSEEYRNQGATKVLTKTGHDEFWGIREYRDGDNPTLIHWRISARLGKRIIKEYHREETQTVCILLDAQVDAGDEERARRFETAVSFAATLAKQLLEQDYRVFFAACGQELVKVKIDRGQRQLKRILTALAEIEPSRERTFGDLTAELDPRSIAGSYVVGVMLDERRERDARAQLLRHRNNSVRLISVDSPAFAALFEPPGEETP